jgi:hypothetical protein
MDPLQIVPVKSADVFSTGAGPGGKSRPAARARARSLTLLSSIRSVMPTKKNSLQRGFGRLQTVLGCGSAMAREEVHIVILAEGDVAVLSQEPSRKFAQCQLRCVRRHGCEQACEVISE